MTSLQIPVVYLVDKAPDGRWFEQQTMFIHFLFYYITVDLKKMLLKRGQDYHCRTQEQRLVGWHH